MPYNYGYGAPEVSNSDIKMCLSSKDPLGTANEQASYLLLQQCCKDSGGEFFQPIGSGLGGWKCYKKKDTTTDGGFIPNTPSPKGSYGEYTGIVTEYTYTAPTPRLDPAPRLDPNFNIENDFGGIIHNHEYHPSCPAGTHMGGNGQCQMDNDAPPPPSPCPAGTHLKSGGGAVVCLPNIDSTNTNSTTTTFSFENLTKHDKNTYIIAGALILGAFLLID